jgi:flagellar biosynthesis anti-sigma factor FlgM
MKIEGLGGVLGPEPQKPAGPKPSEKTSRAAKSDSVSLSRRGQDLSRTSEAETVRNIRADKVEEARAKIESGYFNTPEFTDKLADKLLKDFGIKG